MNNEMKMHTLYCPKCGEKVIASLNKQSVGWPVVFIDVKSTQKCFVFDPDTRDVQPSYSGLEHKCR